jgi:hypothetical protein
MPVVLRGLLPTGDSSQGAVVTTGSRAKTVRYRRGVSVVKHLLDPFDRQRRRDSLGMGD